MKFIKGKLGIKKLFSGIGYFFVLRRQWVITLFALALLAYAGYLWYAYIINPQWDDSRKQEYISTKKNEAVFNQQKFDSTIGEITRRKNEFGNNVNDIPDIFNLK